MITFPSRKSVVLFALSCAFLWFDYLLVACAFAAVAGWFWDGKDKVIDA